ncbi:MAG: S4 domain-containing protein, partial [Chitinophagaceae bacterium]
EVTTYVHGSEEYEKAGETTAKLFGKVAEPIESLSKQDLESMEGVLTLKYPLEKIRSGIDVISFLAEAGIFPSKGEARKMIQNGGVSINRIKVIDIAEQIDAGMLLHNEYLLVQKGRKNYYLVEAGA